MNCLILEDEPLATEVLRSYVADTPGLQVKACCRNVFEATKTLREQKIDLIFVDINLPKMNGLEFIKTLNGRYKVILTTAYHNYALEGFDLGVIDYLLKPIEYSRFLQAIHKVFDLRSSDPAKEATAAEKKSYFFNVDKRQVKIYSEEILYIESLKSYVRIHMDDRHIVTKFKIGELEKFLDEPWLKRVHKSFIVNLNKIDAARANQLEIRGNHIPVGRNYKNALKIPGKI